MLYIYQFCAKKENYRFHKISNFLKKKTNETPPPFYTWNVSLQNEKRLLFKCREEQKEKKIKREREKRAKERRKTKTRIYPPASFFYFIYLSLYNFGLFHNR